MEQKGYMNQYCCVCLNFSICDIIFTSSHEVRSWHYLKPQAYWKQINIGSILLVLMSEYMRTSVLIKRIDIHTLWDNILQKEYHQIIFLYIYWGLFRVFILTENNIGSYLNGSMFDKTIYHKYCPIQKKFAYNLDCLQQKW